mmetsp:Transcript_32810/g.51168  ORF Transcript_32810/g.51168 Transcript_32810/m.51168 type:complete len:262 (+) Transcript_32810:372-1157(+)
MDAGGFQSQHGRIKECLRTPEPFVSDGNNLAVRHLVRLFKFRGCGSLLLCLLKIKSHEAQLLLDVPRNLLLGCGGETVSTLRKKLAHVLRQVATGKIQALDCVGKGVALVDRDRVRDAISSIEHDTSGSAGGIERHHSLHGHIESRDVESFKKDLAHLLTVHLGVERSLSDEDRVLLRDNAELIEESMVPDLLHIVPVVHHPMLDRILEHQHPSLGLRLITDIAVPLSCAYHDPLLLRPPHHARKHDPRGFVVCKPCLHPS